MGVLREFLDRTLSGFEMFITEYKYIALAVCCLIYAFANWKQFRKTKQGIFLIFSCCMGLVIIFPLTGAVLQIYQTRFYDYPWIWSCVPFTAVIAWGIVTFLFDKVSGQKEDGTSSKKKQIIKSGVGLFAAVAILYMCGNQGLLQKTDEATLKDERSAAEILVYLEENDFIDDHVIWGKASLMQYMRSHNGQIMLFYGRDMWEAKAGAYDYEEYSEDEIACYNWMEIMSSEHNMYLLEIEQETEEIRKALISDQMIKTAYEHGVNMVILPTEMSARVESYMKAAANTGDTELFAEVVGIYTIWRFE